MARKARRKEHDAGLVVGWRAWRAARAFRKNDDLASVLDALPRFAQHAAKRARSLVAIDRDHLEFVGEPAVERDPEQLPLHQERGIAEDRNEGEGLPGRLMLGGNEAGTIRDLLSPPHLDLRTHDETQQEQLEARMYFQRRHGPASRHE